MSKISRDLPPSIQWSVECEVFLTGPIVDVSGVAERVRIRHELENVAREDIEHVVLRVAQAYGLAMVIGTFIREEKPMAIGLAQSDALTATLH